MKKYRCPKCKTVFEKKHSICPNCGQELHYLDELRQPKYAPEPVAKAEPEPEDVEKVDGAQPAGPTPVAVSPVAGPVGARNEEKLDYISDESYFDGKLSQKTALQFSGLILCVLTLGIYFPWAVCRVYAWEAKHTVIDGHRLGFDGKGQQLLGRYFLWAFLTIITLGIFSYWVRLYLHVWKQKHTHFQTFLDERENQ